MATIFPRRLIFLEQPRTGSTAVRYALRQIGGITRKRHLLLLPKHGEKVMSTIREPYDMWVTWFLNRGPGLGIFDLLEFTQRFDPIDKELYWFAKYADFIVHYEHLQMEINQVLRKLNIKQITLRKRNVTKDKKPYKTYYTPEILKLFNEKYADEFTKYGYEVMNG